MRGSKNAILIGIVVIILLGGIGAGIYYISGQQQSAIGIPQSCSIAETDFTFATYKCPDSASSCEATITLDCQTQTNEPFVVYRGSEQSSFPTQLAVDSDQDGNLEAWRKTSTSGSQSLCSSRPRIENGFFNSYVIVHNGDVIVCSGSDAIKYTRSGASISTSISPVEPYQSSGRELYAGNQVLYECSQATSGSKTVTVTYSDDQPGSTEERISLLGGQTINWNGRIDFTQTTREESQCTGRTPGSTQNSYYECNIDPATGCGSIGKEVFCQGEFVYNEQTETCNTPYQVTLTTQKSIYGTSETITGSVEITETSERSFITVEVSAVDLLGNEESFDIVSTNSRGVANFNLGTLSDGDYKIVARVQHPQAELIAEKNIDVEVPILIRLSPDPDRIQYTSEKIKARAFITDEDGSPENVASWDFTGSKCDAKDYSQDINVRRLSTGEYELSAEVNQECTFLFKVIAVDNSGFRSNADTISIDVKSSEILIKPDLEKLQDKDAGRYSLTFTTLDPSLQPISTTNRVVVVDSDGCESGKFCIATNKQIPAITVSGAQGFYSFSHDYKDGLNTIRITSSSPSIDSTVQEFTVNLFPSSTTDPIGGDGGSGDIGGISTTTIITFVIVGILAAGFVYFVFRGGKKKK